MPTLVKIPIELEGMYHHRFEWNSGEYKKLIGFFCSPGVQLSLVFNDGRQVFLSQFNLDNTASVAPNSRVLFVDKELQNEMISGVLSYKGPHKKPLAVYLIVES